MTEIIGTRARGVSKTLVLLCTLYVSLLGNACTARMHAGFRASVMGGTAVAEIVDTRQTWWFLYKDPSKRWQEIDPILGKRPSKTRLVLTTIPVMAGVATAQYLVGRLDSHVLNDWVKDAIVLIPLIAEGFVIKANCDNFGETWRQW